MIWSFWAPKGQRRNPWVKALKSLEGIVFLSPSLTSPRAMQIGLNASTRPHLSEMWSGLWNLQPTAAVQSHYICEIKNILNFFPLPPRALALIFFFSPTMCFQFSFLLTFSLMFCILLDILFCFPYLLTASKVSFGKFCHVLALMYGSQAFFFFKQKRDVLRKVQGACFHSTKVDSKQWLSSSIQHYKSGQNDSKKHFCYAHIYT